MTVNPGAVGLPTAADPGGLSPGRFDSEPTQI